MYTALHDLLLIRRGIAFLPSTGAPLPDNQVRAVEIELAEVGHALSTRLRTRLSNCPVKDLAAFRSWACTTLLAHLGGDHKHEPLFRRFPEDVPEDTETLWWTKVLAHFLQAEGQPCLFCRRPGTTHVLNPCCHVVCDRCFDGANYSACPVCEHHVDRSSPFFEETPGRGRPAEKVTLELLDLGDSLEEEARTFFRSLCERKQALSQDDREALQVILRDRKASVLEWLPEAIPVRENIAIVFGTLFRECDPGDVLPLARRYMTTATDVLRFLSVFSGTDGSLLPETIFKPVVHPADPDRFWGRMRKAFGLSPTRLPGKTVLVARRVRRFKVARLSRPLRRTLLGLLDSMSPDRLCEDMVRHRSYWVWIGQFLHPGEYEARYPNMARAFRIVRRKAADGTPAPVFRGWYSRLEEKVLRGDSRGMVDLLNERPGEFARRFDHALRVAAGEAAAIENVLGAFAANVPAFATPVLLTLHGLLPTRTRKAGIRVYWPKGRVATGALSSDERPALQKAVVASAVRTIKTEILRRFAAGPAHETCIIDEALDTVLVPFNERTASASAVTLPRGSRISVPAGKLIRLFLHWCQPEKSVEASDLDLSVAFYDQAWCHLGVCSYYQLQYEATRGVIATSAGDLRDAPWPDGATEFVDLDRDRALDAGIRYAVMVINNYAGLPFSRLNRGFAGLMLRDDPGGRHFDARTVELKFNIQGENGIFMPLVLDVRDSVVHWLDMQARGELHMNNAETSRGAIFRICPALMEYFASGIRPSMLDLGLLHAAARCKRVFIRGRGTGLFERRPGEDAESFHARLVRGRPDESRANPPGAAGPPLMAVLYRGDLDVPEGSSVYALFRETVSPTLAASDLLS